MSNLPAVTDQSFDAEVLKAGAAIVDFWGEGWGACVRLAPVVEQVEKEYQGKVKVVGLDAHNNYDTTANFGVMGLPTLVFFKAGKEVARLVGYQGKDKIVQAIKDKLGV